MIDHRALVQTRLRAPEGEENQRQQICATCPVFRHPSCRRDSVWSRAQLEKQAAAEEPDMERTVGKLTVDRQHRLHAKRVCVTRLSTSSQRTSPKTDTTTEEMISRRRLRSSGCPTHGTQRRIKSSTRSACPREADFKKTGSVSRHNAIATRISDQDDTEKTAWKQTDKQSGKHFRDANEPATLKNDVSNNPLVLFDGGCVSCLLECLH